VTVNVLRALYSYPMFRWCVLVLEINDYSVLERWLWALYSYIMFCWCVLVYVRVCCMNVFIVCVGMSVKM
jgi:hypothetical protein